MLYKMKPAAIGARRASGFVIDEQQVTGPEDNPSQVSQQAIRADLTGSESCSALGLTVESSTPVLKICRQLITVGHDPATPLNAYRGDVLSLRIRSISEGAGLEVNGEGTGFRPFHKPGIASLVRANGGGGS